jgi:DtxR family Mn-dependent transcriptional regulator
MKLSESQEDYLKHIYQLGERHGSVTTQLIADHLRVKPASVTGMIKKLADLRLLEHKPYYGVTLTDSGMKVALEILRHHRLLELYLSEVLGYSWDEIHEEAEKLEHHISEKFEARIAEKLGHPTHDPHGDPIPNQDLTFPDSPTVTPLMALPPGASATIRRVRTQDKDALALLSKLDLVIGATLHVVELKNDSVRLESGGLRLLVPASLAELILVEAG